MCHRSKHDVEVEYARAPAAAGAASKLPFDGLELSQQFRWRQIAFDQRDGIGEIASSAS